MLPSNQIKVIALLLLSINGAQIDWTDLDIAHYICLQLLKTITKKTCIYNG